MSEIQQQAERIFTAIKEHLAPLRTRVATLSFRSSTLEKRVLELGARSAGPTLNYQGVWAAGEFAKGVTVTSKGSLWYCLADTSAEPGTDATWKMILRKANDGRVPDHRWQGTSLQFRKPDGSWGELVDLKGDRGPPGPPGHLTASGMPIGIGGAVKDYVTHGYFPTGW